MIDDPWSLAPESTYSRLIRDEIQRQAELLQRRMRQRVFALSASRGPIPMDRENREEADIREKRAMSVYDAMRAGVAHDNKTKAQIEAMRRLNKQLEMMAALEVRPHAEKRSTPNSSGSGYSADGAS